MDEVKTIVFNTKKGSLSVRISSICMIKILNDDNDYKKLFESMKGYKDNDIVSVEKYNLYYSDWRKIAKYNNQLCSIKFYISETEKCDFTEEFMTQGTATLLRRLISTDGIITDDIGNWLYQNDFLKVFDKELLVTSLIDAKE